MSKNDFVTRNPAPHAAPPSAPSPFKTMTTGGAAHMTEQSGTKVSVVEAWTIHHWPSKSFLHSPWEWTDQFKNGTQLAVLTRADHEAREAELVRLRVENAQLHGRVEALVRTGR